jgi:hypothetical protein
MKRTLLILAAVMGVIGLLVAVAWVVPLPLNPYLDFQVLYRADQGILQGIPLYDRAGQAQMVAKSLGVNVEQVFVLPFPYPPWFAVITLPVALLPVEVAVRMWFMLNLLLLMISVWLITDGWGPRRRLYSFVVAPLYYPILGALLVGQYIFPTVLGTALVLFAIRRQMIWLTATGAALLTFKPHIGIPFLLIVLVYLILRRDKFGRSAISATLWVGFFLFCIGFAASPLWPSDYFHSITGFKAVSNCSQCNNLSIKIARMLGGGFDQAFWIATGSFLLLTGWFVRHRNALMQRVDILMGMGLVITLIASPYLQNYDYGLLFAPFFILAKPMHPANGLWWALAFFSPYFGFGLFGIAGEASLILSVLILFMLFSRLLRQLDVPALASYNTNT